MPLMKTKNMPSSLPTLKQILRRVHIIVVLVAVTAVGLFLSLATLFAVRFYAYHNIELIAHSVNSIAESLVVSGDQTTINKLIELIGSYEEIGEIKVLDNHGKVLAAWVHPADTSVRNLARRFVTRAFAYPTTFPIIHNGFKIGEIWMAGYGLHFLYFLLIGIPGMLGCLALSTLLALFLTRKLLRGIVSSLNHVTEVAHNVSENRAFGLRVPSAQIAELDILSNDFNRLLHQLEIWQTNLAQENDRLAYCATHDSLTGLANRAFFEGRLSRIIGECPPGEQVAILYLDCDGLKKINDSYGHAAGDVLLITVANRMQAQLRKNDLVARLGGDEFAVLLAPIHDPEDVLHIADNILMCMKQPIVLPDGSNIIRSISIGIAFYPEHASTPETLLAIADHAMYRAKHHLSGGCRVTATTVDNETITKDKAPT